MVIMESPDEDAAAAAYASFSSSLPPLMIAPDELRRVKFLCSFGGSILPRPLDGKLRYVGGETRIVSVPRDVSYEELMLRMRDLFDGAWSLKYQQPEEDLDALISVVNDDDVTNMMEEYDKLGAGGDGLTRLRIFLFSHPDHDSGVSSTSPAGAQFDSSDERDTERRYVDALNSLLDGKPQFSMDALAGGTTDSRNLTDQFLSHSQFNMHRLNIQRYSDAEGSRSPVYRTPGHHHLHDPREFPPSPSSRPHHPAFEPGERISEDYLRQTPTQQSPRQPNFVENLVWLPPGGIGGEKAGFPGNLGHIHTVCESSNVCEHCMMAAVRRNPLTAPEARFHDNHWKHLNPEGTCPECIHLRDGYLLNQENGNFDHHERARYIQHHQLHHLPMDRNGTTFPLAHGNFYDPMPPNYIHDDHHHLHTASDPANEVFHDQIQYGAHFPPPVANFGRPAAGMVPPYEPAGPHGAGHIRISQDPGFLATNHLNKVFPIGGPTSHDNYHQEKPAKADFNGTSKEIRHQFAPEVAPSNQLKQLVDSSNLPSENERHSKESSSKISNVDVKDSSECPKLIDLEDHLDEIAHLSEITKKELSLNVSEPLTAEEDLDADAPNITEIESTVAEEEALSKGLQTIKNSDLEEIRELGCGTYGSVYHGKWKGSDVAVKRIKASCFAGKPSERKRLIADFWKEALILSSLHHPNVVSFYGIVRDGPDGSLATVTEFMVNGSLKQVLQKKDRTIDRRKRIIIAMDAAFGMEYLHGKNIVHFDLKCENLLVNMRDPHRPVCKIGDLGLSKVKQKTLVSGGVRGTLPWMAPELLSGKTNMVSEKVDVYSFGIVLWELLTGEEPYAEMHCASIIGGIVNNTLRPAIPTWCDPEWKSLMETCWSADPVDRPSFADVSQRLRKMAASVNVK